MCVLDEHLHRCISCMWMNDESKTHLFLKLFFYIYIRGLKVQFNAKLESSPRFIFCRNLKKRTKTNRKAKKGEQKCNVATSVEKCCNITLRVQTKVEQCCDIMAELRHRMKNATTSTLVKIVKLQHKRRNVETSGNRSCDIGRRHQNIISMSRH